MGSTKFSLRLSLIGVLLVFCLCLSLSQDHEADSYQLILSEYSKGVKIYDRATRLNNSENYSEEKETELNREALTLFRSVFRKMPATPGYDSLRFFTSFHIGELEHYFEQSGEALYHYRQAIGIQAKSKLPDSVLFKPYLYSGIIYYNQNDYDSASLCFSRGETIQAKYNYGLQECERLYNTFGVLHYEKGDYRQAKNYFLKAIEVLPASHPYYRQLLTNYKINLAQIFFKLEDYDEANRIYQQLLAFNTDNRNEIYHNIGMINLYLGASQKAIDYFKKVRYTGNRQIWLYQNTGEAYFNRDQFDSARTYFQKAIAAYHYFGNNTDHVAYGLTLKSMGQLEIHFNKPLNALRNYQEAMRRFYPAYTDTSLSSNPKEFTGVFSYVNLFNTLVAKAEALHVLYKQSSSEAWADLELDSYQSAFKLIDYVERTYNSDEARLFLDKIKYVVHTRPIDVAYALYAKTKERKYLEALYTFDQQNKASILALKSQLKEDAQNNSSNFSKEQRLRSQITRLSLRAAQLTDSTEILKLNKAIRDHEIELEKLQVQRDDPRKIPGTAFLQKEVLDSKTALISYHLSENELTTIFITRNQLNCYQQKLFPEFHESVAEYVKSLRAISTTSPSSNLSRRIYQLLFDSLDVSGIERLIIIPDDELNYLSFESLTDDKGRYLIENFSVQYQYSTSLLKTNSQDLSGHRSLAFAPFVTKEFTDSSFYFTRLPNSLNEVIHLEGKTFTDTAATKTMFLNTLSQFKVLHLATHAVANNEDDKLSFVSFYPDHNKNATDYLLFTEEIYDLPLGQTDLIILSACETASGSLVKGEGIMSLGRAFFYAGCSNMITSLWSASDFSTAYLTSRFHAYLDKGFSIDASLRRAKLDYLNDKSINPRLKNPFYWSHLVFIGSYSPERERQYGWLFISVPVFILLVLVFMKSKKPRKKEA